MVALLRNSPGVTRGGIFDVARGLTAAPNVEEMLTMLEKIKMLNHEA